MSRKPIQSVLFDTNSLPEYVAPTLDSTSFVSFRTPPSSLLVPGLSTGMGSQGLLGTGDMSLGGNGMQGMQGFQGNGGEVAGTMTSQVLSPGSMASDFAEEPPLLEELGINFEHIWTKTLFILMPNKQVSSAIVEDTDLAGPLIFCAALGFAMMMTGKLNFGYIYGYSVFGCIFIWLMLNLLVESGIALYRVCSVVGYGLVPIVLLSVVNIFFDLKGIIGFVTAVVCIIWCAAAASKFFEKILDLTEQRWLIAYPLCLLYSCFALITIF